MEVEFIMEKHIQVTGTSNISWKDAIVQTITEVSKTIDYITGITILNQSAKVNGKKIIEYTVDLDLSFTVDRDRD
jgi:flavin-binding protein dodecin